MRVDPSGSHVPLTAAAAQPPKSPAADAPAPSASPAAGSSAEYRPTADLTRLMEALRGYPENREATVAAVLARLAAGEFDTPKAAADTARAMLGSESGQ
ncbi:MAG: hypothetical protein K2X82_27425 [Gemmataceae bacterium]|nr:hypothetical protein [Gemmataceae bacterium]